MKRRERWRLGEEGRRGRKQPSLFTNERRADMLTKLTFCRSDQAKAVWGKLRFESTSASSLFSSSCYLSSFGQLNLSICPLVSVLIILILLSSFKNDDDCLCDWGWSILKTNSCWLSSRQQGSPVHHQANCLEPSYPASSLRNALCFTALLC